MEIKGENMKTENERNYDEKEGKTIFTWNFKLYSEICQNTSKIRCIIKSTLRVYKILKNSTGVSMYARV